MCGIIGIVSKQDFEIKEALKMLKRLEYRGYDSAGYGTSSGNVAKCVGKIENLFEKVNNEKARVIIAHTRWATHGNVSEKNAHPHADCKNEIFIVHNGIIENFLELKNFLKERGHYFRSDTDSEVIAHLIEEFNKENNFEEACKKAFSMLKGSFAILAIKKGYEKIVGIRKDSPLVVGIGKNVNYIASDIYAIIPYTKNFIFLHNYDIIILDSNSIRIENLKEGKVKRPIEKIDVEIEEEDNNFHHYMIKEIMEQHKIFDYIFEKNKENFLIFADRIRNSKKIFFVAAGSSFHASIYGYYLLAKLGIYSQPILASEFKNFKNLVDKDTLIIAVSQSGETADVLDAIRIAKSMNSKIYSIVNVYGSTLMRESDYYLLMNCGFERGVAATKTFTAQLTTFYILYKILKNEEFSLEELKAKVLDLLGKSRREFIDKVSEVLKEKQHIFLIGRGISYVSALEAALKIKEISYIHAEAFPAGELKHGTLALIEKDVPCIVFLDEENKDETLSNAYEVKARGGTIIGVSPFNDPVFDIWIKIPDGREDIVIYQIIPMQILAYLLAIKKGNNPDYPRNLAKCVTVK